MNLEAIVRISGDGQLKDGSEASSEFRQFLTEVESEKLSEYATFALKHGQVPIHTLAKQMATSVAKFEQHNSQIS